MNTGIRQPKAWQVLHVLRKCERPPFQHENPVVRRLQAILLDGSRALRASAEKQVLRKHEAELMPAMRKYGLGLLPYFPLASGLLTGKYNRNAPMPASRISECVKSYAMLKVLF